MDCVGAIDGTHIPAMIRGRDVSSYRNHHGINSQNVLAACNFDLEFIYVLSGWEDSAHDSKLLNDALSRRNGLEVPQAPIHKVRYHLKEFGGQGRHPRNAEELFNLRHSSLRDVIDRIFGIFKSRFKIFKVAPPFPFQVQAELVFACAGLHNFLRKVCSSDEFSVKVEDDQSSHIEEADNPELSMSSQQQQRTEAHTWRVKIANSMWEDRSRKAVNEENGEEQYDESEEHNIYE
ncbi:hypothetical protein AgCh_013639 [Apium graveolens]